MHHQYICSKKCSTSEKRERESERTGVAEHKRQIKKKERLISTHEKVDESWVKQCRVFKA